MKHNKEKIISEIRRIAALHGQNSLKQVDFQKHAKMSLSTVRYRFGSWNAAVKEAGLEPIDSTEVIRKRDLIPDDELLLDLIRLYNEYGKEPTVSLINAKGKFSEEPYRARWGSPHKAFLIAQKRFPDAQQFSSQQKSETHLKKSEIKIVPETIRPKTTKRKKVVFGEPINFRVLRFSPINEQGVVYLFGMISQELGYMIESIRTDYPDCEGKRCFDKENNKWEHVQIEFEYKSSHFREHGHNPEQCDIIVCWEHDWKDCPVEVLELRSVIKYL
jgi:hypothetical protein